MTEDKIIDYVAGIYLNRTRVADNIITMLFLNT